MGFAGDKNDARPLFMVHNRRGEYAISQSGAGDDFGAAADATCVPTDGEICIAAAKNVVRNVFGGVLVCGGGVFAGAD